MLNYCSTVLICKVCSTSGLITICSKGHKAVFGSQPAIKDEQEEHKEKFSKQLSIATFLKKESLGEILSKLDACDGFSRHAICKSGFMRKPLTTRQFQLPKSETAIIKLIHREAVKAELKSNLNKKEATNVQQMSDSQIQSMNKLQRKINVT